MEATEIGRLAPQLVEALQIVMNPTSAQELRASASNFIEGFKETSPCCVECGFQILLHESLPIVRHFGLALIEHSIKYQWNAMDLAKKVYIKDGLMNVISSGTRNLLEENYHIKTGIAKNVVEIIKREWPQQWVGLLDELYRLATLGETQAELVLLIFMVLAEDVVILNNAHSQRRRDIYQALVTNLDKIFTLFAELLMNNASQYLALKKSGNDSNEIGMKIRYQVAASTLETMAEYMDWIPISHLLIKDGILFQMLCELLLDDRLKYPAVKCLLIVANRKGKTSDRVPLLRLFDQVCLESIFKVALLAEENATQDLNYNFLKSVCQLIFSLGCVLQSLYGVVPDLELPSSFPSYLEALLQLVSHSSLTICSKAVHVWNSLLQHKPLFQNVKLLSFISHLVSRAAPKLIKVGLPSRNDSLTCIFSKLDFDSDEDFSASFAKFRIDCVVLFRLTTSLLPEITFSYVSQWLLEMLKKPVNVGENGSQNDGYCTLLSPSYLEWDALAVCLDPVIYRIYINDSNTDLSEKGISLMSLLLSYRCEDPLILSTWLSCISALFPFIKNSPVVLKSVLDALFRMVVFTLPGQSKSNRSKTVKNVRRHACSSLVKLCRVHPSSFVPFSNEIYKYIQDLSSDSEQLSHLEKCTLIEALILIKNQDKNFEKQSLFLRDVITPTAKIWLGDEMKLAFSSVNNFVSYLGLNCSPSLPQSQEIFNNRFQILGCLDVILGIVKRSCWPEDPEAARAGGFVERITDSGNINRNPAQEFLLPTYSHIFQLLRLLNDVLLPDNLNLIHPDFITVHGMTETDKNNLLGISSPSLNGIDVARPKDIIERFRISITSMCTNSHQILGQSGASLGPNFYAVPNLANYALFSIGTHIDHPFLQHCPPAYYQTVAIPFLSVFCMQMDQRLHKIWSKYIEKYLANSETDNEHAEAQEVIEEQLYRHVTREYLEFLACILLNKQSNSKPLEAMEEDDVSVLVNSETNLSDLGQLMFSCKEIYPFVILTVFDVLIWIDFTSCLRALQMCIPIVKQLTEDKKLGTEESSYLFKSILFGLQKHGQHDNNNNFCTVAYQAYEMMRPLHPMLADLLIQICEILEKNVKDFDDKLLNQNRKPQVSDKKKKDLFKTLVIGVVEKSVGEIFSRKAIIKNLPPLFRPPKPKESFIDQSVLNDLGLCSLFVVSKS
ncbi:hypothetical protein CHUAL_004300 [Chamberlinius hualienensis]